MKKQRILVTGADGFIGSHLVEMLVGQGNEVRAFVYYNSFNSWGWLDHSPDEIRRNLEVIAGDIRDPHGVRNAVRGCDVVLNLAALIAIPYSYRSPDSYVDTNVKGTLNVIQAARDLGVSKVIHTSTSEVYGSARYVPINEEHPLQPQSPYSASKIAADAIALSFFHSFKLPVVIARPFNTYGPRQSARAVIPTIITQILTGQKVIKLGSLHPTRDFSYVSDTCRGMVALAESEAAVGQTVNIGSNFEISIGQTVDLIKELVGMPVEVVCEGLRTRPETSEVERLWCDNTKIRSLTGYRPEVQLRDGLQRTIEWFRNPDNLARYRAGTYNV